MTKPPFPRAVMTWACMALLSLPIGQEARGADTLALKLSAQGMYMGYSGSPTRANLTSSGVLLDMQYLDRGGILAGGDYTTLRAKGAYFRSINDPIDTSSAQGMLMTQLLGAFAEFERALIRERTRAGPPTRSRELMRAGGYTPRN